MIQATTKSRIKLNRRGLTEIILGCAFLSLFTFAFWSWQTQGLHVSAMESAASGVEVPLMTVVLRHPTIMFSTIVVEFLVLLAFALAVVPVTWWLRTDALSAGGYNRVMTPLRWIGEKLHILKPVAPPAAEEGEVPGHYVMNEAGEMVFVPQPAADAEASAEQEVVMVQQPDGTMMAMVQQPDGTMVPAETKPKEGAEGENTEPLLPQPEQTNDILNFDEEEEDPLVDLADIGDILSSAFDEDVAIDPAREAISRSLEDIDIMALAKNARLVLATFKQ